MPNDRSSFVDFLSFRRMITPVIIQVVYWVLSGMYILGAIIYVVFGFVVTAGGIIDNNIAALFGGFLIIIVAIIAGALLLVYIRIACEITVLFFRMNETLTDIKNNTAK